MRVRRTVACLRLNPVLKRVALELDCEEFSTNPHSKSERDGKATMAMIGG